jgi:hypothetical protein
VNWIDRTQAMRELKQDGIKSKKKRRRMLKEMKKLYERQNGVRL